ncbi:DUF4349 domain-containing protein [Chloroflexota bacterium]
MKRLIAGLILILVMLVPVACAKAPSEVFVDGTGIPVPAPAPASAPAPAPAPAPVINIPRPAPAPTPSPAPSPTPPRETIVGDESWATERMIVRTGDMQLIMADVLAGIERIAGLAVTFDGYVVSSSSWREGDRLVGNIAVRVDAERFDEAIRSLRGMAVEVISESTSSKDVTEEYVDLSAKLKVLEATEEQLLRLMDKAEKVEDILGIQRELSRTRGDIERTKGRLQYLERTSATSLINVHLEQESLDVTFTASRKTVKVGQSVHFNPNIAGGISPYSYEWDFGDGNTSTDVALAHTYKSVGSYTVSLKVTDDRGNTETKTRNAYIDVLPGWSAGNIASSAWSGLGVFGQVVANIFIWIGIFSPVWIVIGIILYLTWWRRRKKKV